MNFTESISYQPERLAAAVERVRQTLGPVKNLSWKDKTIGFVGIGASLYSAHVAACHFRSHGMRAFAFCASELLSEVPRLVDVYVVISATGRSAEIMDALEQMKDAPMISISVGSDNPVASRVDLVIETANPLDSSPSAPSFTATMVAIGLLAEAIAGHTSSVWSDLPANAELVLAESRDAARDFAAALDGTGMIDLVGADILFGVAEEGALLLREASRFPAAAFATRNYLHGPIESMEVGNALVTLGGGREIQLAEQMAGIGATVWHLGLGSPSIKGYTLAKRSNALCDGILHLLPLHWLCAELSALKGLENVPFRYRQSDTKRPC